MSAFEIAKQIGNLEAAADLLMKAASALQPWDAMHNGPRKKHSRGKSTIGRWSYEWRSKSKAGKACCTNGRTETARQNLVAPLLPRRPAFRGKRTTKYNVARDLLKSKEGDISKGIPVSPSTSRYRFEDAEKDIIAEYTANGRRSLPELKRRITLHLTPWFGKFRMGDITTSDVLAFTAARLEKKASHAEINRELAVLKRMFSLAVKANRLMFKPHIPMLQEHNTRKGFVRSRAIRGHRSEATEGREAGRDVRLRDWLAYPE